MNIQIKKTEIRPLPYNIFKINPNTINIHANLNQKILRRKHAHKFYDFKLGSGLLDMSPKTQTQTKEKLDRLYKK